MTTKQLKEIARSDLQKIGVDIEQIRSIFFSENPGMNKAGSYYYADSRGFYCTGVGDRGRSIPEKKFRSLEDTLFDIYWYITFLVSTDYAVRNKIPGQDWRRPMFSKRLELLKTLGDPYYLRGMKEIEVILANSPYRDSQPMKQ